MTALIGSKGMDVFLEGGGGEGAWGLRGEGESECQKRGGSYLFVRYPRGGDTHLSQNFFNEDFCEVAFHFSYRLSFSFHLL